MLQTLPGAHLPLLPLPVLRLRPCVQVQPTPLAQPQFCLCPGPGPELSAKSPVCFFLACSVPSSESGPYRCGGLVAWFRDSGGNNRR